MITDSELSDIETRAKIATQPPWLVHPEKKFYVQMPFSTAEQVLLDRDANAAFCANARDDVPSLVAEVRRLREELHDSQEHGWNPLMKEIAKLSDAMKLDDGDWSDADDDTLAEQFDPWIVIKAAVERVTMLSAIVTAWNGYQKTMDHKSPENKQYWVEFLSAMAASGKALAAGAPTLAEYEHHIHD